MKRSLQILSDTDSYPLKGERFESVLRFNVKKSRTYRGNAAVVSLGCAKNQVDSEVILGALEESGFEIVGDVMLADVVVVNTCGFLKSAVKESVDTILDVASLKKKKGARLRKLIVAGCMVERYKNELINLLPEVDAFITTDDILKVGDAAEGSLTHVLDLASRPYLLYDDTVPRRLATPSHYAYVKISEGCNRPCTFCVIPSIRGRMRSRDLGSLIREVSLLRDNGIKEINLVAQDLTAYGADLKNGVNLVKLLIELDKLCHWGFPWIRLLYGYPLGVSSELLETIVRCESVCNYLDLPLQHCSEGVLSRMKRPLGRFSPRKLIPFIRKTAPEIALRTTFIVGFPGETESDVKELEEFVKEGHFTHLGVFTYSREEGTPSFNLKGHISEKEKRIRRDRIMKAQKEVVERRNRGLVGKTLDVLIEGHHSDSELLYVGRTKFQAPEVDNCVIINNTSLPLKVGEVHKVLITDVAEYDLIGTVVSSSDEYKVNMITC